MLDYVNGIGNLSRDQYINMSTLCFSLHHFVLRNSIATKQKKMAKNCYIVITAKQTQSQDSFELISVKEPLLHM